MATLKVKQVAKQRGLTLAKLADELGMHPVNLSASLNGNPTVATLDKIAEVLGVSIADLFEKESKPQICGFVKVGNEVLEVSSIADIENVLNKAKELK